MLTLFGSVPGPFDDLRIKGQVEALPRPRTVVTAWRDRIILLAILAFSCIWATLWTRGIYTSWQKGNKTWSLIALFFLAFLILMTLLEMRRELRNRALLIDGELALGRVTHQRTTGTKTRKSEVSYEFTDAVGRTVTGRGYDWTKKYVENMPLIVFYEPRDPSQNVSICTTLWKLRTPNGSLIQPG